MLQKSRDDYIKMCRRHHTAFDIQLWEDIGNKRGLCVIILYSIVCWTHHNNRREGGRHASQRRNPGVKKMHQTLMLAQTRTITLYL